MPGPEALTAPMPRAHADPVQGPMPAPGTNPTEVLGIRPPGLPAGSGAAAPQATHDTTRLDPALAGAQADPGAATTVLARGEAVAGGTDGPGAQAPAALLSRRAAAELGVYAGAGLSASTPARGSSWWQSSAWRCADGPTGRPACGPRAWR